MRYRPSCDATESRSTVSESAGGLRVDLSFPSSDTERVGDHGKKRPPIQGLGGEPVAVEGLPGQLAAWAADSRFSMNPWKAFFICRSMIGPKMTAKGPPLGS